MSLAARTRYWLLLLPLVGLLAATYWLNMQTQTEPPKAKVDTRFSIDALMENFSATKMNENGLPHFTLSAKQLHHYPEDDSTTLAEPLMSIYSDEGSSIQASAREGKITSKEDEVILQNQVELVRHANEQLDKLALTTEWLHILPNQHLISTDRPITLTDARTTVNAIGMDMDYQLHTFTLHSKVKSIYVPAKK